MCTARRYSSIDSILRYAARLSARDFVDGERTQFPGDDTATTICTLAILPTLASSSSFPSARWKSAPLAPCVVVLFFLPFLRVAVPFLTPLSLSLSLSLSLFLSLSLPLLRGSLLRVRYLLPTLSFLRAYTHIQYVQDAKHILVTCRRAHSSTTNGRKPELPEPPPDSQPGGHRTRRSRARRRYVAPFVAQFVESRISE